MAARVGTNRIPSGPTIPENSRFCVAASDFDRNGLSRVAYVLFAAMIEMMWNLSAQPIVIVTDTRTEHGLNRAGWPMRRLASPSSLAERWWFLVCCTAQAKLSTACTATRMVR
ncbi:acyl-homoserine-lactone synthase [Bradyrhizobium sp. NC92]|uniref:acyl-homoserine-lactone synthase n=1 Tax=Bradyrhizobium sp. (strain NC92) TaxID=55395 RepID=UPI003906397B